MTPTQVFYCDYSEIFKATYFEEHLQTTASVQRRTAFSYHNNEEHFGAVIASWFKFIAPWRNYSKIRNI